MRGAMERADIGIAALLFEVLAPAAPRARGDEPGDMQQLTLAERRAAPPRRGAEAVYLLLAMTVLAGLMLMVIVMLRLQQYFWTQRRLVDLRLEAIHELNWLLAQFLTNCIADAAYVPGRDFLHSLNAATSKARTLFSQRSLQALQALEAVVGQAPGPPWGDRRASIQQLIAMQDAALRALYQETGFRLPG